MGGKKKYINIFGSFTDVDHHIKFDDGLLRLHEADEAAVDWLTTYGS